jgi:hypothetical protein
VWIPFLRVQVGVDTRSPINRHLLPPPPQFPIGPCHDPTIWTSRGPHPGPRSARQIQAHLSRARPSWRKRKRETTSAPSAPAISLANFEKEKVPSPIFSPDSSRRSPPARQRPIPTAAMPRRWQVWDGPDGRLVWIPAPAPDSDAPPTAAAANPPLPLPAPRAKGAAAAAAPSEDAPVQGAAHRSLTLAWIPS